jgi:hypothetical protein
MIIKIHSAYRNVVAICDSELLGKIIEDSKRRLDLSGPFFQGDEKSEEEAKEILEDMKKEDATFNIVGKESCRIAKEIGLIGDEGIILIDNIPFALVLI